jgi:hypothetical protein
VVRKADEAHSIHEDELRQWLLALRTDFFTALSHIPTVIHHLLHDLGHLGPDGVTEKGEQFLEIGYAPAATNAS